MNRQIAEIPKEELTTIGSKIHELRTDNIGWKEICPQFRLAPETAKKIYRTWLKDHSLKEADYIKGRKKRMLQ